MHLRWPERWGAEGEELAAGGCLRRTGSGSRHWEARPGGDQSTQPAGLWTISAMPQPLATCRGAASLSSG
jgi:hypothetical protein